jgi:hypothetical protein
VERMEEWKTKETEEIAMKDEALAMKDEELRHKEEELTALSR